MSVRSAMLESGTIVAARRPWPRIAVDGDGWRRAILGPAQGQATMLGLWADGDAVHMAFAERGPTEAPISDLLVTQAV